MITDSNDDSSSNNLMESANKKEYNEDSRRSIKITNKKMTDKNERYCFGSVIVGNT